jgi:threonine/homoserine/homoserine lactone efflux protein
MAHSVVQAFLFGATLAIAVGPIALLIMTVAAHYGLRAGSACGAGAALADAMLAVLAYLAGAALLGLLARYSRWLGALGGAVLLLVGVWLAARAVRAGGPGTPPLPERVRAHPLTTTCALTLANPLTLVIFAGFAPQLALARAPWLAIACGLATGLGSLLVQLALASAGVVLGRLLSTRARRWLAAASGVAIALFGVVGLWTSR